MPRTLMFVLSLLASLAVSAPATASQFIGIGTGGLTGVYYPTGGAICRLLNRGRKQHGIRCAVESTGGSIFNINAIRNNDLDFGIAQSDWQYYALKGESSFASQGPMPELRAVFSIHSEPFTVVARDDANINSFDDLKGKRVNIGNPGSGQRGTMEVLMAAKGWSLDDFSMTSELKANEQSHALCDNKVEAMVYTVGHPNASIEEAFASCDSHLVPVEGDAVDKLIRDNPFYAPALIPAGMYAANPKATPTFGVKATLVTDASMDEEVVYQLTRAVFENLDKLRQLHPAFAHLKAEDMLQGNAAPFHPGALRYYREAGLLKSDPKQ